MKTITWPLWLTAGLPAGTTFRDGLTLTEHIPQGHKVALQAIPGGQPILRYGEVIGLAMRDIAQGAGSTNR